MEASTDIVIGISSCVLGEQVRYDGGHKRLQFVTEELSRHFRFEPVCPEVAIGLGIPRPTIRLTGDPDAPRVRGSDDADLDVTIPLKELGEQKAKELDFISGYIFCAKSPSCGMERVPVYSEDGRALGKIGVGAYAKALMEARPLLPVEENGRLNDALLRENFVLRVMAMHRWQSMMRDGLSVSALQSFHRNHKFLLLAHHQQIYRDLGPMLANIDDLEKTAEQYIERFMAALKKPASRRNHVNTLMHMQGFFKEQLSQTERDELNDAIHKYREGVLPLLYPLALLRLYLKKHPNPYLEDQTYLEPYPEDLQLRYGL